MFFFFNNVKITKKKFFFYLLSKPQTFFFFWGAHNSVGRRKKKMLTASNIDACVSIARRIGFEERRSHLSYHTAIWMVWKMINEPDYDESDVSMDRFMVTWRLHRCDCFLVLTVPVDHQVAAARHWIDTTHELPACQTVVALCEYHLLHGHRYPTLEEYETFVLVRSRFASDPVSFAVRDRVATPTRNLESWTTETAHTDDGTCSICQDKIIKGASIYRLPCCGQPVHALAADCMGESSILQWLQTSRKCPCCNQEVVIVRRSKRSHPYNGMIKHGV